MKNEVKALTTTFGKNNMIIHTYATDGYTGWLNFFLETLKAQHDQKWKVVIDGRDLKDVDINGIKKTYNNVIIKNKSLDYKDFIKRSGLSKSQVFENKNRTEKNKSINEKNNIMWKQFISVEDRYRNTIIDTINEHRDEDYIFHFDADTYIRKPIDPLINMVYENDISTIFREQFWNHKELSKKLKVIHGCFMAFKICPEIDYFFNVWQNIIDSLSLKEKPMGFGQISFYEAYLKTKNDYKWGKIPKDWFFNKGGHNYKDCMVWTGCKGSKMDSLIRSKRDYRR